LPPTRLSPGDPAPWFRQRFGSRTFKAPPGGAVVFSCSLLHRVTRVTRGRRYAFLPFLYDDAAAAIRERNAGLVGPADPHESRQGAGGPKESA
jgi:hypothetical protein